MKGQFKHLTSLIRYLKIVVSRRLSAIVINFVVMFFVCSSFAREVFAESFCIEVFYPFSFENVDISEMNLSLATDYHQSVAHFVLTEKYLGFNSLGQVLFEKKHPFVNWPGRAREMPWLSTRNSIFGAVTPQGDLRAFIGIVGPHLARHFGFEIVKIGGGSVLKAPGADLLKSIVLRLNRKLKKMKKDPITYLPVKAGFLLPEEILKLSVSADGDFQVNFAYADADPKLAGHEIAYHFGEMLFSKKFHERSRAIDAETLRIANILRHSNLPGCEAVAQGLMAERSRESDFGNGNIQAILSASRIESQMVPFGEILLPEDHKKILSQNIQMLIHPFLTPREAVLEILLKILGFVPTDLVSNPTLGKKIMRTIRHPLSDQVRYLQFLRELQKENNFADGLQKFERISPEEYMNDLILGLDSRISDLLEAFEKDRHINL